LFDVPLDPPLDKQTIGILNFWSHSLREVTAFEKQTVLKQKTFYTNLY